MNIYIYIAYKLTFKCETAATEITIDQSMKIECTDILWNDL